MLLLRGLGGALLRLLLLCRLGCALLCLLLRGLGSALLRLLLRGGLAGGGLRRCRSVRVRRRPTLTG